MSRLVMGLLLILLAYQAHSQIVIKRCPDGSTVGGNSSCPSRSSGNSTPVYKNWDMYGAIALDTVKGLSGGQAVSVEGYSNAKKRALAQCGKNAKLEDCTIALTFKNSCGAIATIASEYIKNKNDPIVWTGGVGRTIGEAESNAVAACNKKSERVGIAEKEPCGVWGDAVCAIDDRF